MIYTTLNKIREHHPCSPGWGKLLKHLGKTSPDDEPLPLLAILDSNGLADTLWCVRTLPEHDREWRLYAVWYARQVQHLLTDPRSLAALDVAERYANGEATDSELAAARAAAREAVWASGEAAGAAAAEVASGATARMAWVAAEEAGAAWEVSGAAASEAAWAAARAAQEQRLRAVLAEIANKEGIQ